MVDIMAIRTNCVYCNKIISKRSREHVIQNALGGLYESEDICCPECNNYVSKYIDCKFTTIFNPILANIENLRKTHNKNSTPSYTGTVVHNDVEYKAVFKGQKVVACPELSKKFRCDISKIPTTVKSYNFDLTNEVFKTGITKIAFNYALSQGIDADVLAQGLNIEKSNDKINKISFNYPIIPFYPLNKIDEYIELRTPTTLYHNMILFSQSNTLWCYIDLFNTFQYYVLLSDSLPAETNIYANYMQLVQKTEEEVPDLTYFRTKELMLVAQKYGIEPCVDRTEMAKRIQNAINKKPLKQPMDKIILPKLGQIPLFAFALSARTPHEALHTINSMSLYCDEDNNLHEENFRTVTINPNSRQIVSYPDTIMQSIQSDMRALNQYTQAKFLKLNSFLINNNTK